MGTYLQIAVLGLAAGAVYVALAVGLIAVYRSTGILNFAQGAMVAWGPYVYVALRDSGDLILPVGEIHVGAPSVGPALAIACVSALLVGLASHLMVFRPLRAAPPLAQVVASVGVLLVMMALVVLRFGGQPEIVSPILTGTFALGDTQLSLSSLFLAVVAVGLSVAAWAYFRFTRSGIATRASAEDERAVRLMGYSPDRLAAAVWAVSIGLGGLVVTLASPAVGLNPTIYAFAIVPALGVALVARLTSIAVACVAGLALGSFQAVVSFLASKPWWPAWAEVGLEDAIPFLLIVVALSLFGGRLPSRGSLGEMRLPKVTVPQLRPAWVLGSIGAGVLLLLLTSGSYRFGVITSMIFTLLALSYVLLTGFLGQISLAQMAFAGTAGVALSKLTNDLAVPFPLSILIAASLAAALGLVVALPAVRIRGAQLAVVTMALAVALEAFVFRNPELTPLTGNRIADPTLFGLDLSIRRGAELARLEFGLMVLAIVVAVTLLVARLMRGNTGRAFLAVRSNERAAAAVGINVPLAKLIGFAISAFIAGIAGSLIGYSRGQLSADSFAVMTGISLLAIAYLGGIGSITGAVLAGLLAPLGVVFVLMTETLRIGQYYTLIAGLALIVTAIFNPVGIAGTVRAAVERARSSTEGDAERPRPGSPGSLEAPIPKGSSTRVG